MSLFEKKKEISRRDLKDSLRRDSGRVKGGWKKYDSAEREKMANTLFGSKYGSKISKTDYKKRMGKFEEERKKASSAGERKQIEDKIKYLRQLGGKDF